MRILFQSPSRRARSLRWLFIHCSETTFRLFATSLRSRSCLQKIQKTIWMANKCYQRVTATEKSPKWVKFIATLAVNRRIACSTQAKRFDMQTSGRKRSWKEPIDKLPIQAEINKEEAKARMLVIFKLPHSQQFPEWAYMFHNCQDIFHAYSTGICSSNPARNFNRTCSQNEFRHKRHDQLFTFGSGKLDCAAFPPPSQPISLSQKQSNRSSAREKSAIRFQPRAWLARGSPLMPLFRSIRLLCSPVPSACAISSLFTICISRLNAAQNCLFYFQRTIRL